MVLLILCIFHRQKTHLLWLVHLGRNYIHLSRTSSLSPSSPLGKHISWIQAWIAVFRERPGRLTVPWRMDSENWICSNGCSFCPSGSVTNGVSFASEKWVTFHASNVLKSSAGTVTECHPIISPFETLVGTSTLPSPDLISPLAYFLSFGHNFLMYSACCMV